MKIGIMGGTFYPIHKGHLQLAEYALKQYELDKIWFMPNRIPPHKESAIIEEMTQHRAQMVRLAIADTDAFIYQPYEVEKETVSYSYQTMQHFKECYPDDTFYFIIGADSLFSLEKWRHPEILAKHCILLVAGRDGKGTEELEKQISNLKNSFTCDIRLIAMPFADISSTKLRKDVYSDKELQAYLPNSVFAYIIEHQLFLPDEVRFLMEKMQSALDEERYVHSLGVMRTAALLAHRYDMDVKRAMLAGLLHDCAKCIPGKEKVRMCKTAGISISKVEEKSPGLLHAKLGAYLAETQYHVNDEGLLDAIRYHCTGRPYMTLFDKIIYIADYIEPNRDKAPNLANIRKLAYEDIDKCLLAVLKATLAYLEDSKQLVDPMTAQTYEYYRKETDYGTI